MKKGKILIVDDNRNVLSALRIFLGKSFEEVVLLSSPANLISMLKETRPDVVLLDMNFSAGINTGNEGLYWLERVKAENAEVPVVLFTAYADIDLAVEAIKRGATDFVVKPWDNTKLLETLTSAMESRKSGPASRSRKDGGEKDGTRSDKDVLWGESLPMRNLMQMIEKVARTDANVLITGENGTGKQLVACKIHELSKRHDGPLVTVDIGSLTETLFESELFGHVKGAFTDAKTDREGKFEAAEGGTLFLDEIANVSYTLQAKLLTAIQSRQVTRVGSNKPVKVDIRLISATNRNLAAMAADGSFREDLLYRINTIELVVPPLRDRGEDVVALAEFFARRFSDKYGKPRAGISPDAAEKIMGYGWPGNVRELEHSVEKAVILSEDGYLTSSDFMLNREPDSRTAVSIEDMEKAMIIRALETYGRNVSAIAAQLGVSRPTLYIKMKKYGIE
ncbi:MAG: sigma-54 dependent transcriptional regulator [Alistipes sp.]|nr:sigma-54 dependent transcriptional regulator [Alistipes sp.]